MLQTKVLTKFFLRFRFIFLEVKSFFFVLKANFAWWIRLTISLFWENSKHLENPTVGVPVGCYPTAKYTNLFALFNHFSPKHVSIWVSCLLITSSFVLILLILMLFRILRMFFTTSNICNNFSLLSARIATSLANQIMSIL